jgi:iron complex transport system substrate-binding protein
MRPALRSLVVLLALVVTACSGTPSASPPASPATTSASIATATPTASPLTVRDDAGREVTFSQPPERIVSAAPSATELAFAVGLGDAVVAVDKFSNYPPEAASRTSIGSYVEPDLEAIVGARPDLVLLTDVHLADVLPALEQRGIRTLVLSAKSIEGVYLNLLILGRVSGEPDTAEALVDELRARVARVEAAVAGAPPVRTFYELDETLFTAGPGTFIDDVITRAGGVNIAADASTDFPQLSAEEVVASDPEVIILADEVAGVTPEAVRSRQGWSHVSAVVNDRITVIDPDIASRPGPRIVDAIEQIARILHPDLAP